MLSTMPGSVFPNHETNYEITKIAIKGGNGLHNVCAGTRKAVWIFVLVPVLVCILSVTSVMLAVADCVETDMQDRVDVSTASNASAGRQAAGIATMSDAEDDSVGTAEETSEDDSEEAEWSLDDEPLLNDLFPIASASNAEFQEASYPPQISVVVPAQILIVVNPDGSCLVAGGSLENQGESAVLLTGVTFSWQTEGELDADDIFTEWNRERPYAVLTLEDGVSRAFEQGQTANEEMTWELESEQVILEPGEERELVWLFELNGNGLNCVLDAEEEVTVATVTYTVRSLETS